MVSANGFLITGLYVHKMYLHYDNEGKTCITLHSNNLGISYLLHN